MIFLYKCKILYHLLLGPFSKNENHNVTLSYLREFMLCSYIFYNYLYFPDKFILIIFLYYGNVLSKIGSKVLANLNYHTIGIKKSTIEINYLGSAQNKIITGTRLWPNLKAAPPKTLYTLGFIVSSYPW